MITLLSVSADCGALLTFAFLISYGIPYMSLQVFIHACVTMHVPMRALLKLATPYQRDT